MFEKDAEEIMNNHCDCEMLSECLAGIRTRCTDFEESKKLLIEGIEFGYNKANEWHKPSEKLPEECSLVLAYLFEETEPTICEYVVSDQWECLPKRIVFCSNDQVRKWKEIVLPELKEIE